MDIKKVYLSWQDIEDLSNKMIQSMKNDNWIPTIIVGITRGGLLPGNLLSQHFKIPMSCIDVSFRDNHFFGPESSVIPELIDRHRILVVDDINDSGETFAWVMNDWFEKTNKMGYDPDLAKKYIKFGCLIHNTPSNSYSDYYGMTINKDEDPSWVSFPWEHWFEKY